MTSVARVVVPQLAQYAARRNRRIAVSAAAAVGARGIRIATLLISVPLALHYLGPERYGLWLAINSLLAFLNFADFGLGNGLVTILSKRYGAERDAAAGKFVSTGFLLLLAIACLLALVLLPTIGLLPLRAIFKLSSAAVAVEARQALLVLVLCLLLMLPLSVVQRAQLAYQEGYKNAFWDAAGSMVGFAALLLAIRLDAGLPHLILATAGAPVCALALNSAAFFRGGRRALRPQLSSFDRLAAREILELGFLFFLLQVVVTVAFLSDNFIVARLHGAQVVPLYGVPQKLFEIITVGVGILLAPLWPAYGEAVARHDYTWVRRTLTHSLVMAAFFSSLAGVVLVMFGQSIIRVWVGPALVPSVALLTGFALWAILFNSGAAVAMFLNGMGKLRFQVICAIVMAVVTIALKLTGGRLFGLSGIVWGTVIGYTVGMVLPCLWYIPRLLRRLAPTNDHGDVATTC